MVYLGHLRQLGAGEVQCVEAMQWGGVREAGEKGGVEEEGVEVVAVEEGREGGEGIAREVEVLQPLEVCESAGWERERACVCMQVCVHTYDCIDPSSSLTLAVSLETCCRPNGVSSAAHNCRRQWRDSC